MRSFVTAAGILLLLVAAPTVSAADETVEQVYAAHEDIVRGVEAAFEPSYITFTGGYDRTRNIRSDDLWYEAQIYVHYNVMNNCPEKNAPCYRDDVFRLYIPIRLQVRQLTTHSSPVVTPSYNPGLRLYYWRSTWATLGEKFNSLHYVSLGVHHYSNGQSGEHYVNGVINTRDGSFSSDYVELAYYYEVFDKEIKDHRVDLEDLWKVTVLKYLTGWTWESPQNDYYAKWMAEVSRKKRFTIEWGKKPRTLDFDAQLTAGYKWDRKYVKPGENANFKDNTQYRAELVIPVKYPKISLFNWNDVSLYLRWDKGFDYYNINYQNRINRIQLGFIATNY